MQKHRGDPAAVPSQPTLGHPDEGLDQETTRGKAPAARRPQKGTGTRQKTGTPERKGPPKRPPKR